VIARITERPAVSVRLPRSRSDVRETGRVNLRQRFHPQFDPQFAPEGALSDQTDRFLNLEKPENDVQVHFDCSGAAE